MSNKLCPASAKAIHSPDTLEEEVILPSLLGAFFPFSTQTKNEKEKTCSAAASSSSSSSPPPPLFFNPLYVFLLRLDRLAPPAGERLERRCIPNQIKGETSPLVPPKGLKLESDLGLIRQVRGVGGDHTLLVGWQR